MAPPCGFAAPRAGRGPAAIVFLRGVPGVLPAAASVGLATFLRGAARCRAGENGFGGLAMARAPSLARIAVAEAACCGTCRKTQAGAASSLSTAADRAGRRACASRRAALAGKGAMIVAGPRQHGERNPADELQPATPARQLLQDVRAHQPDEAHARKPPQQPAQRVDRVARAEHRLDRAGDDAAAVGDAARGRQPLRRTAPCRAAASADCRATPAARPDRAAVVAAPARRCGDALHAPD